MKIIFTLAIILVIANADCPFGFPKGTVGPNQFGSGKWKADNLMKLVKANQENYGWYTVSMAELFIESMETTFNWLSDYMPCQGFLGTETRKKLIHSVGVVASARYVSTGNHGYTGVWQGADNVIVRVSSAKQANAKVPFVAPGVGVKFLRDNVHSADYVAMYALDGQKSFNMFEHDFTNHVPDVGPNAGFALNQLKKTFMTASKWPTMLGLKDTASIDQHGNSVGKPNYPFRLIMHPSQEAHTTFSSEASGDSSYFLELKGHQFDVLWEVYAEATPNASPVKIGEFQMTSPFYESKFGDKDLFFQHSKMEDDFEDHPEWVSASAAIVKAQGSVDGWRYKDLPWN